jgi:hypothetical protein
MSDSIKNMYTEEKSVLSSDTDYMNLHLLLNNINELRQDINKMNEQLNKKFDHLLSYQTKPSNTKPKKSKKNNNIVMTYFTTEYVNNPDKFNNILDTNIVNELMSEYENLFKDLDEDEMKMKQAECIWSNLIINNKEIVDMIEQMYNENENDNDDNVSEASVKKAVAKKTVKKATTTRKTKKAENSDTEVVEVKKTTKRASNVKKTSKE